MTQRSEQLVLDYLSEVALLLHGRASARERTAYLTAVRSRIESRRAAAGRDEETVRRILLGLGTPEDLVERDFGGRDLDLEDDEMIPPKPRHADRPPPPWRGGPSHGLLSLLEGPGRTEMSVGERSRTAGGLRGLAVVVRHHGPEAAALGLLLLTVPWGWNLAFVWVLSAALIALSRVWTARDKWIGLGLPLLGCAIAMALWPGEAKFVDRYIQESLPATGVIGLGLASLVSVFLLYPRVLRSARAEERSARTPG
ncbi:hypothetical protein [Nocardiopsis sp. YSL2]|uniref:hypothetical protein n=1 Tax=Nocardiopsis sp. YSL2 TaxID=2939492 RepID=UPI0026F45D74|nr:hypothetical protein [Nocardiopsis sp. YSL2]